MARISPLLKSAIKRGRIALAPGQGEVATLHRRQLVKWHIYTFVAGSRTSNYIVIEATTERLTHRLGLGHSLDLVDMVKVARPQTSAGRTQVDAWLGRRDARFLRMLRRLDDSELEAKTDAAQPVAAKPAALPKPPKPQKKAQKKAQKPQKATQKAAPTTTKAQQQKPIVPPAAPVAPALDEPHVILVLDESMSMRSVEPTYRAQVQTIIDRLRTELPKSTVEICDFGEDVRWTPACAPAQLNYQHRLNGNTTPLYYVVTQAASKASLMAQKHPVLIYLVTDGEATDTFHDFIAAATRAVVAALATNRITFACVGPKTAAWFFRSAGIPAACIRDWNGTDAADLSAITKQAAQGISNFAAATKQGRTKLDSFFVDVVKTGATVARAKRELSDITASLRRVKVSKYISVEDFVRGVLKIDLIPGAVYYQLVKGEKLLQGRRIILQPRDKTGDLEQVFLTGPAVRPLLGLPTDRDVEIEPKNLGDFVVYLQSASPTRKLTPGTLCLFDELHVSGATEPTFVYGKKA